MKLQLVLVALAAYPSTCSATISAFTGWEDRSAPAILGSFGNIEASYETEDTHAGDSSLYMIL